MKSVKSYWGSLSRLMRVRIVALCTLFLGASGTTIIALLFGESFTGFLLNFGTEMAGAFVTFILFDLLIGMMEKSNEEEKREVELKTELIIRMGSNVQNIAVASAHELRIRGWLADGSVKQKHLQGANLEGAILFMANLEKTSLEHGNLRGVNLGYANLRGAELSRAMLDRAFLECANLQAANLVYADLEGAVLRGANLESAILNGANLHGADLTFAILNIETILPDGTHWNQDTDMLYFTNSISHISLQSLELLAPAMRDGLDREKS